MGEEVRVWYDPEGDYLEVLSARKKGYFRETDHDAVMEKVDEDGSIIFFYSRSRHLKRPASSLRYSQKAICLIHR
jgi:hypothetical protein